MDREINGTQIALNDRWIIDRYIDWTDRNIDKYDGQIDGEREMFTKINKG